MRPWLLAILLTALLPSAVSLGAPGNVQLGRGPSWNQGRGKSRGATRFNRPPVHLRLGKRELEHALDGRHRVVLGVTGASGSGKGLVSAQMKKLGFTVIEVDLISRELLRTPPREMRDALVKAFGSRIIRTDGSVNQKVVQERRDLDAAYALYDKIKKPYIRQRLLARMESIPKNRSIAIDSAYLHLLDLGQVVDSVLYVNVRDAVRKQRLVGREHGDSKTDNELDALIELKFPSVRELKRIAPVHVIDNGGTLEQTEHQVLSEVEKAQQAVRARSKGRWDQALDELETHRRSPVTGIRQGRPGQRVSGTRPEAASRELAKPLLVRYPGLEKLIRSPDRYLRRMKGRFAAQRRRDPTHPYAFDYTEVGLPVLTEIRDNLRGRLGPLQRAAQEQRSKARRKLFPKLAQRRMRQLDVAIEYLEALEAEVSAAIEDGRVTYQNTYEICYFFSRAIGHFDIKSVNWRDRLLLPIDRKLLGYEQLPIEREYQQYRERRFTVFQNDSANQSIQRDSVYFDQAFSNPKALETLFVPTTYSLGSDILTRLVNHDIYLMEITFKPVSADGFTRPSGDFLNHDLRHAAQIYAKRKDYAQDLAPRVTKLLRAKMDVWNLEAQREMAKVTDPDLRAAIKFFYFSYHHDRGYPMVPTSYLLPKTDNVANLKYLMKKLSNQPLSFSHPKKNLARAYTWLRAFWLARLDEENAIVAGSAK